MRLKYYGTCAAEGLPGLFCSCDVCERARKKGGRNIRTRSQTLINDDLLIDFSADTYMHVLDYGLDLRKVKACLITHSHDDHFYPYDFIYRMSPTYAVFPNGGKDKKPLDVYATKRTGKALKKLIRKEAAKGGDKNALKLHKIKKFCSYDILGYKITPLRACHAPETDPVIFIIQKDGKSILYANDTGYFSDDTWKYIEQSGMVFDFVSLDCTCTNSEEDNCYKYHMSLAVCKKVKERLLKKNADGHTVFCLHHFSHNGGYIYDELVPIAEKEGFIVSYDTMEVHI